MPPAPSPPDRESIKLSSVFLVDHLDIIDPGQSRAAAAELNHSLHRALISLKDSLNAAFREIPDPAQDSFGTGFILHCPPKPNTLYLSAYPYTHPYSHGYGSGGGSFILWGGGAGWEDLSPAPIL